MVFAVPIMVDEGEIGEFAVVDFGAEDDGSAMGECGFVFVDGCYVGEM